MRTDCARNIILIGMPGAGKSTVGVLLAKRLGYHFVDSDLLLQAEQKNRLQRILATEGLAIFKQLEEKVLTGIDTSHTVVATGGSAVYSDRAMAHLKAQGIVVYLDTPLDDLLGRIEDMDDRGVVIDPDETFADLFRGRAPLYRQYADVTIDCRGLTAGQIAATIESAVCTAEI